LRRLETGQQLHLGIEMVEGITNMSFRGTLHATDHITHLTCMSNIWNEKVSSHPPLSLRIYLQIASGNLFRVHDTNLEKHRVNWECLCYCFSMTMILPLWFRTLCRNGPSKPCHLYHLWVCEALCKIPWLTFSKDTIDHAQHTNHAYVLVVPWVE
jgi:hypothetical protein